VAHAVVVHPGHRLVMHITDIDQGMLGVNGFGALAMAICQIAAVSMGYGPITVAGQGRMSIASVART
jgi:hypothetical protein